MKCTYVQDIIYALVSFFIVELLPLDFSNMGKKYFFSQEHKEFTLCVLDYDIWLFLVLHINQINSLG